MESLKVRSMIPAGNFEEKILPATTLFVYIDESGNFDFSASGTKHFVMTAFVTTDPMQTATKLARLKYSLLSQGVNLSNFHASEDSQRVRNQVFSQIAELKNVSAHTLWLKKHDLPAQAKSTSAIYELLGIELAKLAAVEANNRDVTSVVLVFDKTLTNREEQAFRSKSKALLTRLKYPLHLYFHNVSKDYNGQVADYIAWSHYVALERSELRPVRALPLRLTNNLVDLVQR